MSSVQQNERAEAHHQVLLHRLLGQIIQVHPLQQVIRPLKCITTSLDAVDLFEAREHELWLRQEPACSTLKDEPLLTGGEQSCPQLQG